MVEFVLAKEVLALNPDLAIGIILAEKINNHYRDQTLVEGLRAAENKAREKFSDIEQVKALPVIQSWQQIHREFGNNPNRFPPSIFSLVKRVVQGKLLPSINPLVDIYNIVSLNSLLPAGGEDLAACQGSIQLCRARGDENFTALGETNAEPPEPGEVIYCDDIGAICRKFNWREAARTCLSENTTRAIIVLEALPPHSQDDLSNALQQLSSLIEQHCGGCLRSFIFDKNTTRGDLTLAKGACD